MSRLAWCALLLTVLTVLTVPIATAVPAAGPPTAGARVRPAPDGACPRDQLTLHAGAAPNYSRRAGQTEVQMRADWPLGSRKPANPNFGRRLNVTPCPR
ncbi:MAG: hypothetical protein C0505_19205 [Leptothrix sp. (in: Bacteria)]|nr:hypothetical protein [Leptothrix sp. (in: b-proteobacteria)]